MTLRSADFLQRSVLFLDTLREHADELLAHEKTEPPPLLDLGCEAVRDARPAMVFDPFNGDGPGIGGPKRDPEAGMPLHEGQAFCSAMVYDDRATHTSHFNVDGSAA